jgi:hypothetical protein
MLWNAFHANVNVEETAAELGGVWEFVWFGFLGAGNEQFRAHEHRTGDVSSSGTFV